jgi:hypothetical protein
MIGIWAQPVHEYSLCLGTHHSSRKESILQTKGAEPNNNDVPNRGSSPPQTRQSALDKSEFSGPDPEQTGVGLIFDQLGLMSTIRRP